MDEERDHSGDLADLAAAGLTTNSIFSVSAFCKRKSLIRSLEKSINEVWDPRTAFRGDRVKTHFLHRSFIVENQQNIIELVTRPGYGSKATA